jgi:hypothetical protein
MAQEEPDNSESKVDAMTRQIHRVVIEGEGSATVVEFQSEGESYWLLIEMKGKSVTARWLEQNELDHFRRDDGKPGDINIPPFPRRI